MQDRNPRGPEAMPRGIAILMSVGVMTMIASVILLLAVFAWQPWQEDTVAGGIQGGADPTPTPTQQRP